MNDDVIWFRQQPKRHYRIRRPAAGEFVSAWLALGDHNPSRRHVIVWRVPKNNPGIRLVPDGLMRIPFVSSADETIDNNDTTLSAVMANLMSGFAQRTRKQSTARTWDKTFGGFGETETPFVEN